MCHSHLEKLGGSHQAAFNTGILGGCNVGTGDRSCGHDPFHSKSSRSAVYVSNTLGNKRIYLWAWFLPSALTLLATAFTLMFGIATLDMDFTMIRTATELAKGGSEIPAEVIVLSQTLLAVTFGPFINMLFTLGEELGWRGFLLPKLMPLGQWKAVVISGVVWVCGTHQRLHRTA